MAMKRQKQQEVQEEALKYNETLCLLVGCSVCYAQSCPALPVTEHARYSLTRLLCPWNYLGKKTGVGCHFLLQGIHLLI